MLLSCVVLMFQLYGLPMCFRLLSSALVSCFLCRISFVDNEREFADTIMPMQPCKASTAEALVYICTWYSLSTLISVYNKEILGKKNGLLTDPQFEGGFPAPLMMSAVQFLGQYCLAVLGHALGVKRTSDPSAIFLLPALSRLRYIMHA
jgi:hypothetical protein